MIGRFNPDISFIILTFMHGLYIMQDYWYFAHRPPSLWDSRTSFLPPFIWKTLLVWLTTHFVFYGPFPTITSNRDNAVHIEGNRYFHSQRRLYKSLFGSNLLCPYMEWFVGIRLYIYMCGIYSNRFLHTDQCVLDYGIYRIVSIHYSFSRTFASGRNL